MYSARPSFLCAWLNGLEISFGRIKEKVETYFAKREMGG